MLRQKMATLRQKYARLFEKPPLHEGRLSLLSIAPTRMRLRLKQRALHKQVIPQKAGDMPGRVTLTVLAVHLKNEVRLDVVVVLILYVHHQANNLMRAASRSWQPARSVPSRGAIRQRSDISAMAVRRS